MGRLAVTELLERSTEYRVLPLKDKFLPKMNAFDPSRLTATSNTVAPGFRPFASRSVSVAVSNTCKVPAATSKRLPLGVIAAAVACKPRLASERGFENALSRAVTVWLPELAIT